MAERIGVFGGTFDPIHIGHLVAAEYAAAQTGLDRVIFVPAGDPWQKSGSVIASAEQRYAMVLLAIADNPRFEVSRVEIDREGPSYTVDTLSELASSDRELFFILGADALGQITTWRDHERVAQLASFIGVTRPGSELEVPPEVEGRVQVMEVPGLDIASSDIRARQQQGQPVRYLVPDAVLNYLKTQQVYT